MCHLFLSQALRLLACIYSAEPFLTWVYIRHMTGLFSKGVLNLKVREMPARDGGGQKGYKEKISEVKTIPSNAIRHT